MTSDQRPDIPDLPPFHYWDEGREPCAWNRDGEPYMSIRKRTLFGSKEITRVYMPRFDKVFTFREKLLIREDAQRLLGKVMGI